MCQNKTLNSVHKKKNIVDIGTLALVVQAQKAGLISDFETYLKELETAHPQAAAAVVSQLEVEEEEEEEEDDAEEEDDEDEDVTNGSSAAAGQRGSAKSGGGGGGGRSGGKLVDMATQAGESMIGVEKLPRVPKNPIPGYLENPILDLGHARLSDSRDLANPGLDLGHTLRLTLTLPASDHILGFDMRGGAIRTARSVPGAARDAVCQSPRPHAPPPNPSPTTRHLLPHPRVASTILLRHRRPFSKMRSQRTVRRVDPGCGGRKAACCKCAGLGRAMRTTCD